MDFFQKLKKPKKGGYIFLSHSHDDIEKVREIRNDLEHSGFEPLCFYLKCLTDHDEIEDLIKREIDAREWFVFVNSENSRKSKWVTMEREYITRTNRKKIITLDIEDEQSIAEALQKISRNLRIYISCGRDVTLARRLKTRLLEKDYLVFLSVDDLAGDFKSSTESAIYEASQDGCVIFLLTPDSLHSVLTQYEVDCAIRENGNIIPILVGDVDVIAAKELFQNRYSIWHLPKNPTDEDLDKIIDALGWFITQ